MNAEIVAILGVGVALGLFNWRALARMEDRLDKRIGRLEEQVGDARERLASLEALFPNIIRRETDDG